MPAYYTYLPRLYTHGPLPPPQQPPVRRDDRLFSSALSTGDRLFPPARGGTDSSDSVPVLKVRFYATIYTYMYIVCVGVCIGNHSTEVMYTTSVLIHNNISYTYTHVYVDTSGRVEDAY